MAGSSLLALLDDITAILDDVALMSKVAAKKTAGVLGDDLALNAKQVSGVLAERELPVVWAVAKGSLINKMILVPIALLLSYFLPVLITPLLVCGGLYLCFEGMEKIVHSLFSANDRKPPDLTTMAAEDFDLVAFEKDKIKGAIRTDFILSAEIIVIALGTVDDAIFIKQAIVVSLIAIVMTLGVYGLVAAIVKLDDLGLLLIDRFGNENKLALYSGRFLLGFAPHLMKFLTVAGTLAMFLVGGGIIAHNISWLHHINATTQGWLHSLTFAGINLLTGLLCGGILVAFGQLFNYVRHRRSTVD